MSLSEAINALKAYLYDRAFSPLVGAFAISWSLWNYKLLLVIFSGLPPAEKFSLIHLLLYPTSLDVFFYGVLFPFLTTVALIYIYPVPARWVFRYWKEQNRKLRQIQQVIDDETPLTREEEKKLREAMINQEIQFARERAASEAEISRLRNAVATLEQQVAADVAKRPSSLGTPLVPAENRTAPLGALETEGLVEKILKLFARSDDGGVHDKEVAQALNENIVRIQGVFDLLEDSKLVIRAGANIHGLRYILSPEGRKYALDKGYA